MKNTVENLSLPSLVKNLSYLRKMDFIFFFLNGLTPSQTDEQQHLFSKLIGDVCPPWRFVKPHPYAAEQLTANTFNFWRCSHLLMISSSAFD